NKVRRVRSNVEVMLTVFCERHGVVNHECTRLEVLRRLRNACAAQETGPLGSGNLAAAS
ncbi:hypothetical protein HPB47_021315, partial [Ixodes persulcatus]